MVFLFCRSFVARNWIGIELSLEREAYGSRIWNRGRSGDTPEPHTRGVAPCTSPMFHAAAKVLKICFWRRCMRKCWEETVRNSIFMGLNPKNCIEINNIYRQKHSLAALHQKCIHCWPFARRLRPGCFQISLYWRRMLCVRSEQASGYVFVNDLKNRDDVGNWWIYNNKYTGAKYGDDGND